MVESFKEFMEKRLRDAPTPQNIDPVIENTPAPQIVESRVEETPAPKKEEVQLISEQSSPIQGYKIYRDKPETFICDMEITGANPVNSKARIIIESKDLTYMFEGSISDKGQCKIPLKKMNFLNENETGKIKLEIIAEDMVFNPWVEDFVAVSSKKVSIKHIQESEDISNRVGIRITNIR